MTKTDLMGETWKAARMKEAAGVEDLLKLAMRDLRTAIKHTKDGKPQDMIAYLQAQAIVSISVALQHMKEANTRGADKIFSLGKEITRNNS